MTAAAITAAVSLQSGAARPPVPGRDPVARARRERRVALVLATVTILLVGASVLAGEYWVPPRRLAGVLAGGGSHLDRLVLLDVRLPRVALAVLVGWAFGMSGALLQLIARNPLASPDVLGISAGAAVGAIAVTVAGPLGAGSVLSALGVPGGAILGAAAAAALLHVVAWRRGLDPLRLVLAGVGISAVGLAVAQWLIARAALPDAMAATAWLAGSLSGRSWQHVWPLALACLMATIVSLGTRSRRLLVHGRDTARSLGVSLPRVQALLLAASVVLAAVATAAAGPIGFVALVAAPLAQRLSRSLAPPLVTSALLGAVLVVGADLVIRSLLPVDLPVGVLTTALGAPYLLAVLIHRTRTAR